MAGSGAGSPDPYQNITDLCIFVWIAWGAGAGTGFPAEVPAAPHQEEGLQAFHLRSRWQEVSIR